MQLPPLGIADLTFLLAVIAITLLITAELSSSSVRLIALSIKNDQINKAAFAAGALFLILIAVRIMELVV